MVVLVSCQRSHETPNYASYSFPEYKLEYNREYPEVYKPYLYSAPGYNRLLHSDLIFKPSYQETLFRPYFPIFKTSYYDPDTLYRNSHDSFSRYPTHATYDTVYRFYK